MSEENITSTSIIRINPFPRWMAREEKYKLLQDSNTIKEAFIIDELQSYMDLKDPSNPKWVKPVRVRLQEKGDWKRELLEAYSLLKASLGESFFDLETSPYARAMKEFESRLDLKGEKE